MSSSHYRHVEFGAGDLVKIRLTGWDGMVLRAMLMDGAEPEYEVRVCINGGITKDWFRECELRPQIAPVSQAAAGSNVVDLAEAKTKGCA